MSRKRAVPRAAAATPAVALPMIARSHQLRTAGCLAIACCAVYLSSLRCSPAWDTIPARYLPFSIIREGNLDLNEFSWLQRDEVPYFLRRTTSGKILSKYPVAAPLLAVPIALPAVWWLRGHQVSDDDVRFRLAAVVVERVAASLIAALSVSLLFLALGEVTTPALAAGMALAYGLATNTWATSSQAHWQHGPAELSLAGLSLFLMGKDTRPRAVAASGFAALGVVARPTMAIFALLAAAFIWRERPQRRVAFLVLPSIGALALVAYNLRSIGSVLGGYAGITFDVPNATRFFGLLISPNRGLLVYTPIAALALPGLLRWRSNRGAWAPYLAAGCIAYLVLYASFYGWWGGHTYGPRFLIDILPGLAVCAVPTVERLRSTRLGLGALAVLAAWSVTVQAIGAYCEYDTWNYVPISVDHRSQRVWDWGDPQIVRALRGGWQGAELAPLLWQALTDPRAALLKPLGAAALAGELVLEDPLPRRYRAGQPVHISLRVTNRGNAVWPAFSDFGDLDCRIVATWMSGGKPIEARSNGLRLPRNLGPGESASVSAVVDAPEHPGTYELALSLVQMMDSGHGGFGGAHLEVPVAVE